MSILVTAVGFADGPRASHARHWQMNLPPLFAWITLPIAPMGV